MQHICALIVFMVCITTVVVLLTKCKVNDPTMAIGDDTDISSTAQVTPNPTISNSKFLSLSFILLMPYSITKFCH
jgi:hypothetical protein